LPLRFRVDSLLKKLKRTYEVHNRLEVSRSALAHNYQLFGRSSQLAVFPVLKGNAYGHGVELVAKALRSESPPYIAVDGYFEALRIRNVSSQPVLVMGAIKDINFRQLKYDNFTFVVQHSETVRALGATNKKVKVHVEVNTGMNRYGVKPEGLRKLVEAIKGYPNIELEGVMSHLADSDGDDPRTVAEAAMLFDQAVEEVRACGIEPRWCHVAQTAGSAVAASKYANAMRLGIGLYGVDPFVGTERKSIVGLQPAAKLVSTITNVIDLRPGDKVGYNYTYTAKKKMKLGVLPLGYFEGLNRTLSNAGFVKYKGRYLPIVGRVCMNHTMVDLTGSKAGLGDEVIVYGDNPHDKNSIDAIARQHGLFNYNLLTALSSDVRRVAVD
jgi:alanine racemase